MPAAWRSALFLPGGSAGETAHASTPPRLFFLASRGLSVFAQPAFSLPAESWAANEIEAWEVGRFLLRGWITLHLSRTQRTWDYNRRSSPPVEQFLRELALTRLPAGRIAPNPERSWGDPAPRKLTAAGQDALLPGEHVLLRLGLPAGRRSRRRGAIGIEAMSDVLCLSGRRLLWLTDRQRGQSDPYGVLEISVPLSSIAALRVRETEAPVLEVSTRTAVWSAPLACVSVAPARAFVAAAMAMLQSLPSAQPSRRQA